MTPALISALAALAGVLIGGSHGLAQVDPDTFNVDVLAFACS